jgi:hypothetical protein
VNQSDYKELLEFVFVGGGVLPHNEKAKESLQYKKKNEIVYYKEAGNRDLKLHRCYFSLLNFIYGYLTNKFHEAVPESEFYKWLKHLKKEYKVVYSFIDNDKIEDIIDYCLKLGLDAEIASKIAVKFGKTDMIEYESISFGRMSNDRFKEYVKELLPYIYKNVIGKFYDGDIYNGIVETIEEEYKKFLSKL